MAMVALALALWAFGWWVNVRLAEGPANDTRGVQLLVPVIFGVTILAVWELLVLGLNVPMVILPAPSLIAVRFSQSTSILWADFVQTILKGALSGYIIGCAAEIGRASCRERV